MVPTCGGTPIAESDSTLSLTSVLRCMEYVHDVDAVAQIARKGHILLTEALDSLLALCVRHPEYLAATNLRFVQKLDLVRALVQDEHTPAIWELLAAMNTLRNEFSHSLNAEKQRHKTQRVIGLYLTLLDNADQAAHHQNEPDAVVLMRVVAFCLGFLLSLAAPAWH
jgi:hypothetical protein